MSDGRRERKGNGGKGEHEGKGEGFGHKGKQQETRTKKGEDNGEEQDVGRTAPNMGAGGSHPQAILDPEKEEEKGDPKDEMG